MSSDFETLGKGNKLNRVHSHRISKSRIALSVLAVLASAVEAQAIAQWDLPTQPLAESLRAVAAQTDSNIIFDKGLVAGQSARPLKMKASTDEALARLLEGTGLTYRHLDDRTVTIQPAAAGEDNSSPTSAVAGRSDGRMRLAQAEAQKMAPAERGSILEGRQLIDIEEIVVTGTNIRGIENNTAPVIVLSREYIDATGFGTTAKLIESLPQNFALGNQSGVGIPEVSGAREQGSSINLRGLGQGTTLVLLNGRRVAPGFRSAAVDISALPLTALERVEVLTDGASAIYGSDAVGGVVNFILREDFEGAETRLRSGFADGTDEIRVSQALGNTWDSGNALFSAEYYKRDGLVAADRDFVPSTSLIGGLLPEDENYSAVFTGNQLVGSSVSLFADMIYTQRDSTNRAGRTTFRETGEVDNSQGNATLGLEWLIGQDWQIELSGSYGRNDLNVESDDIDGAGASRAGVVDTLFESEAARLKADGTLFKLPGGDVRAAIGADWRSESYEESNRIRNVLASAVDSDQTVRSAFAEVYGPLIGPANAMEGVQRLEVSLAGRYDDYSNFGSSFDPQYGLMWEPITGFRLRGRYGTSYKAPNLVDYSFAGNGAAALTGLDPGDPFGFSYQLQVVGTDAGGLKAQESKSTSIGLEFLPPSAEGLAISLNYYKIEYRNRIANPPQDSSVLLNNPASFANLVIRNPTPDQVNQLIAAANLGQGFFAFDPVTFGPYPGFTPDQVTLILDLRRRNLSVVDTSGLDLSTQYEFKAGQGRIALGLAGTYVLDLQRQLTSTSAPFDAVDTFGNPPEWRARGFISWQQGGWATNLFVNHTDSYVDNRALVPTAVSSYTTVDARLSYSFSERSGGGVLSGLQIAASVQNVLDEDPPRTVIFNPLNDLGFDPTNASPLGRFIALEITKAW